MEILAYSLITAFALTNSFIFGFLFFDLRDRRRGGEALRRVREEIQESFEKVIKGHNQLMLETEEVKKKLSRHDMLLIEHTKQRSTGFSDNAFKRSNRKF